VHAYDSISVALCCSYRVGRRPSPQRRRSAVVKLPADCVSPTASMSPSTSAVPRAARQTKHSSLTSSSPAPTDTPVKCVAAVKSVSQQRYSLSAIVIPRLSISDDADSGPDHVAGQHARRQLSVSYSAIDDRIASLQQSQLRS